MKKEARILVVLTALIVGFVFSFTLGTEEVSAASKRPAKVTISSISSYDYNAIKITWKGVKYAKKYQVYRATSKNGKYKRVKTTTARSYINTGLTTGKRYYYKVRAVNGSRTGYFSYKKYATPTLKKAYGVAANKNSYNSLKLSWNKVNGAKGYQIYRATSKSGKYTKIKSTTSTSYINTGLTVGKTYYYKVRPYRLVGKSYKYGPYSSIVYNKTSLGIPSNVTVAIEDEGIIIKWTSVQGAKKYIVERNDGKTFSTTSTSYKDVTVKKDTTYKYKVKAYNTIYSSYSPYSPEIIIETNNNDDELIPEEPIKSDTLFEYKGVSISLGQEWSDEILNSLKEKTVGYYTTVRPDYIYDPQGNLHDATVHMFNIRDYTKEGVVHNYDEFIQIQVSEGKIVSWETACDKFGTVKGKDFIKGMVPTELELPNGVYVHSNIYATGLYNAYRLDAGRSTYSQNAALTGGLANFSQVSMISFKENQKYWDAEKTIAFHWINALRVEFGSEPLKYLSAFEKGVYSGILSDDTYYENQVCGAQAKAETIAMSKAIDSSIKATHETVNYPVGPLAGILSAHNEEMCEELANIAEGGENLASSGSGESCVEIYLTSSAHLSPLLDEHTTHVGIGIKDYWNVEMFGMDVFGINTDDVINYSNN